MKPEQVWKAAWGELQLQTTKPTFDAWLRDVRFVSSQDDEFVLMVKNAYIKDWLESRLMAQIQRVLSGIAGRDIRIQFIIGSAQAEVPLTPIERVAILPDSAIQEHPRSSYAANPTLNPKYRFETFVEGNNNCLAYAAAKSVANNPSGAYNPLFLHGGAGLGKTHLLHAIGNACAARGLRVQYVPSETFTNELIGSIRNHTTDQFREKYRTVDVLLLDDIQFIIGKESTQMEIFHTFNELYEQRKQIVFSSDQPPDKLKTLEDRLRSRFGGGLTIDIQNPDWETRVAILESKVTASQNNVPRDVLAIIAESIPTNVRELEGGLTRVLAHAHLLSLPLSPATARAALSGVTDKTSPIIDPEGKSVITPARVVEIVARMFKLSPKDLRGTSRRRDFILPRQLSMFLMRADMGTSLLQIGEALGGRDHSTVLHGCEKIQAQLEKDTSLQTNLRLAREELERESSEL